MMEDEFTTQKALIFKAATMSPSRASSLLNARNPKYRDRDKTVLRPFKEDRFIIGPFKAY